MSKGAIEPLIHYSWISHPYNRSDSGRENAHGNLLVLVGKRLICGGGGAVLCAAGLDELVDSEGEGSYDDEEDDYDDGNRVVLLHCEDEVGVFLEEVGKP